MATFEKIAPEKLISIYDLYNVLNDCGVRPYIHKPSNFLLVDVRSADNYSLSHVITAKQFKQFIGNDGVKEILSKYAFIVVYGYETITKEPSLELVDFMSTIESCDSTDVVVLKDTFQSFYDKFSFLCTNVDIETEAERKLILCYPSIIISNSIYQGRGDQATNEQIIETLGITHIINISDHKNAFPSSVKYFTIRQDDVETSDLFPYFEATYEFIHDALREKGRVLIHCHLGISRSSTITLAYLLKSRKCKLGLAFDFLRTRRSRALPNPGFFQQLSEWEARIFGKTYTDIEPYISIFTLRRNKALSKK